MCGVLGMFNKKGIMQEQIREVEEGGKLIKHRGPDYTGIWNDNNIVLAHNKLSILDLSEVSNQPVVSQNVIVALNGEIYNYKKLIKSIIC